MSRYHKNDWMSSLGDVRLLTHEQNKFVNDLREWLLNQPNKSGRFNFGYNSGDAESIVGHIDVVIETGLYDVDDAKMLNELREDYIKFQKMK